MTTATAAVALSIVIPAKNEALAIAAVVAGALSEFPHAEVSVVDDGSNDDTGRMARDAGATVISHSESLGNGAAIKAGARVAHGELIAFMDGDGQHHASQLKPLLEKLAQGY